MGLTKLEKYNRLWDGMHRSLADRGRIEKMKGFYVNVKLGSRGTIYAKGTTYRWNSVWETYNSVDRNELLLWTDLDIDKK